MKKTILAFVLLVISMAITHGEAYAQQQIDCSDKRSVSAKNQRIKELVVLYVGYLKGSKISEDAGKISTFRKEYEEIQSNFNVIYGKMKKDKKNLAGRRLICERYGGELQPNIEKAEKYVSSIGTAIDKQAAGFGIDDIVKVYEYVSKQVDKKAEDFYNNLKWPDWDTILSKKMK